MTVADIPDVVALERAVFSDPWSVDSFVAEVDRPLDMGSPTVFRDPSDSRLLGYSITWFVADEVHVGNIAVAPHVQRRGMGSLMLRQILDEGIGRSAAFATLEVRPSNEAALRLYERFGFRKIAIRKNYYQQDREDAYVLVCTLAPTQELALG